MRITVQIKFFLWIYLLHRKCCRNPSIRTDRDRKSYDCAENKYNWIFQWKYATL